MAEIGWFSAKVGGRRINNISYMINNHTVKTRFRPCLMAETTSFSAKVGALEKFIRFPTRKNESYSKNAFLTLFDG
jgi:hypothetical protein